MLEEIRVRNAELEEIPSLQAENPVLVGSKGNDAKINGYNTLTINGGNRIELLQEEDVLTISSNIIDYVKTINGQSGEVTLNIPTKTSDLTNDSGYAKLSQIKTKTSELINDSGFITNSNIPTKTSDLTNDSGFITNSAIPTNVSQLNNDAQYTNKTYVDTAVNKIFDLAGNIKYNTVLTYAQLQEIDVTQLTDGIYIYLVKQDENYPRLDTEEPDDYYSTIYMYLSGRPSFEFIGKLNVSELLLEQLITESITTALGNYYNKSQVYTKTETETAITNKGYITETELTNKDYVTNTELTNKGYQTETQVNTLIQNYVNGLDATGVDY